MGEKDIRPDRDGPHLQALIESESMLREILDHTVDTIVRFDSELRYDYVNDRVIRMSGIAREHWIGKTQDEVELGYGQDDIATRNERLTKVFESAERSSYEDVIRGTPNDRWFETTLLPQLDSAGAVAHVIVISRDTTGRKMAEEALIRAAARDPLTGLANRTALLDVLDQAIEAGSASDLSTAVLLVDLDHFKLVNDALGHAVGDRLLQLAAERLAGCVGPHDLVARHGGDEFVVVMRDLKDPAEGVHTALKVVEAFREPLLSDDTELSTTASIGISVTSATRGRVDANDLIREADTAMYAAKASGRDGVSVFDERLRAAIGERLRIENQLRRALPRGEFVVHYQPEVDLDQGRIRAVEALLRWNHPSGEVYSAARFINIAEDSGQIVPIGTWVLNQVCHQTAQWENYDITVRLNLAARQLDHPDLLLHFLRSVDASGCDPTRLCVEITESALLHDTHTAAMNLAGLSDLGVSIALDDFGTGYASLTYLRRYHVDTVKLDRSFVVDLATNENDQRLTAGIVALAAHLGVSVTAEGVETIEQAELVKSLGCDGAQGYLYSRAVAPAEIDVMLATDATGRPLRAAD